MTDRRPIDKYLKKGTIQSQSLEETATLFVDLAIKAHVPEVGPPIDLLRIDKNGAVWIERKEECPEMTLSGYTERTG